MSTAIPARLTTLRPVLGIVLALLLSTCSVAPATGGDPAATPTVLDDLGPLSGELAAAPASHAEDPSVDEEPGREEAADGDEAPAEEPDDVKVPSEEPHASEDGPSPEPTESESEGGGEVSEVAEAVDVDEPPLVGAAEPTRVRIPRIGVDNPVVPVGLHPDKSLVVPEEPHVAGWYTGRPKPGETGPAILTGHNQWGGELGVFWDLHELGPGDVIEVHHDDGSVVRFEIDRLEQHRKDAFPTQRVYGDTDRAELRIITCGGHFDRDRRSHVDNVIAFGVLVD